MIVAVVTFCIAFVQLLLQENVIPSHLKSAFFIALTCLSGIPLMIQFVILLAELSRAGMKYCFKLILHRLVLKLGGNYGPASNLLVIQYSRRKFGDYPEATGWVWICSLYLGHALTSFFGMFVFGDAFSGVFTVRYVSVALWISDNREWPDCIKPEIDEGDIFKKTHVKDVRHLNLTVEFRRVQQTESAMGDSNIINIDDDIDGRRERCTTTEDVEHQPLTIEQQETSGGPPAVQLKELPPLGTSLLETGERSPRQQSRGGPSQVEGLSQTDRPSQTGRTPRTGDQSPQVKNVSYHVIATGSQESLVSKLYYETWEDTCSEDNAKEFLTLMEILSNDSFVVKERPPNKNDQILVCEELGEIVNAILNDGKMLSAKRVYGMSYV